MIVSVKRDREDRTSTTTLHEHEVKRGDRSKIRNIIQSSFRATPAKAGGDPESRNFKGIWILTSAGMTARRD